MSTRLEAHKFFRLEPQVNFFLSTLYRVTAMNDVPSKKKKGIKLSLQQNLYFFKIQIWNQ